MGELGGGEKGRPQVCSEWTLLVVDAEAEWLKVAYRLCLDIYIWLRLLGHELEMRTKMREAVILLIKSCPLGTDC